MTLAAAQSTPSIAPAIVTGAAALAGVLLAQVISWQQRRRDQMRQRRTEMAQAFAHALSLIMEAIEQIDRGARSKTSWHTQLDWTRLRTETWPAVRTLLLTQASQETGILAAKLRTLTLELQRLLVDEEDDHIKARQGWDATLSQVADLQDIYSSVGAYRGAISLDRSSGTR